MNFKNRFVNEYITKNKLKIISFDEDRPWGGFYVYESGADYDKKILWVKPAQFLSLQYHGTQNHPEHSEEWIPLTKIKIVLGNLNISDKPEKLSKDLQNLRVLELQENESIKIPQGFLHALVNPFKDDIYLLETRRSPVEESSEDREANITRIYDQTQRDGTPPWPEELVKEIKSLAF
jgi:mannose-6-phosphate isomerase-like protein (cupin superfamily)